MPRHLRSVRMVGLVVLAGLAACSGRSADEGAPRAEPAIGTTAAAIVGGTVDTTRPDVLLLRDDTAAGFRCTATLIAPNLIITARHCVGKRAVPAASTPCQGDATTNGAQDLPSYDGDVVAQPMYVSDSPTSALLARAQTIYDDGATTTCSHDVALLALDRAVVGITPSQLRRTPLAQGDPLVAMGFGWTDHNAIINADQRMKGATSVLALGPVVYSFKPFGNPNQPSQLVAIAAGEIGVQGVTMTGDSGGPAFDSSGQLAAIVSRGYNDASYGPGTFTTIAAHLATIDAALVATGNGPVADAGADASNELPPPSDGGTKTPPGANDAGAKGDDAGTTSGATTTIDGNGCAVVAGGSGSPASHLVAGVLIALGLLIKRSSKRTRR